VHREWAIHSAMYAWHPPRTLAVVSSLAIVAAIGALLIFGLGVRQAVRQSLPLVSMAIAPEPEPTPSPKPPEVRHAEQPAPKHDASPRNLRNRATQVVAPPARPIVVPPPVVTAPQAGSGFAANTGASVLPGPGQGAGGIGNGTGGGGRGGAGNGAGDGAPVVGPRRTRGELRFGDLPEGVLAPGQEATVEVLYWVEPDGRASDCRAERSSGYPVLDALACRLIVERFRFRPAKDKRGRPVRAGVIENHTWVARAQ
jgi:protein TonB